MNSGHLFVSSERKVFIPDSTKDFSIDASDTEQLKCAYALVKKNHVDVENKCAISYQNLDCSVQYISDGLVVSTLKHVTITTTRNDIVVDQQIRKNTSFFLTHHPTKVFSVLCGDIEFKSFLKHVESLRPMKLETINITYSTYFHDYHSREITKLRNAITSTNLETAVTQTFKPHIFYLIVVLGVIVFLILSLCVTMFWLKRHIQSENSSLKYELQQLRKLNNSYE